VPLSFSHSSFISSYDVGSCFVRRAAWSIIAAVIVVVEVVMKLIQKRLIPTLSATPTPIQLSRQSPRLIISFQGLFETCLGHRP
jgi:hypothetical protein